MFKQTPFNILLVAGALFGGCSLRGAEYFECRGNLYSQIGSDTNTYSITADFLSGKLGCVAVRDSVGPLEVTLENNKDAFIWTRGGSNSWTLYVAPREKMVQINRFSYLNQLGSRWYVLLNNLMKSGGREVSLVGFNPNDFRIVYPEKVEMFSSEQTISNGVEITYFDVSNLDDKTRITNFVGWTTLRVQPTSAKEFILQAEGSVCFSSRVFTNWVGEFRAVITNRSGVSGDLPYPSLSTNYGMVIDDRLGTRKEYGISNLTSTTWPTKPMVGGAAVGGWLISFRWGLVVIAMAPVFYSLRMYWIKHKNNINGDAKK